ncbi:Hypothetical predicted protein [Cloeon dipterum]|uniref:GOLD domain-containing protein n=1 Tax=Cloeon dipterum TaxID=197152 RepID=A0A8S1DRF2_9INSE|nr:Hypothetical predicted protein [Cloeon dipterum]
MCTAKIFIFFSLWMMPQHILGCTNETKRVGTCLHTFLERDFISMDMVVYPRNLRCDQGRSERAKLEGPTLASDCKNIGTVLDCFLRILSKCQYLEDFFKYRKLIEGLESVFDWICGDESKLRQRMGDAETHFACISELTHKYCFDENISENVWNRILRLEDDTSICRNLQKQRECALSNGIFNRYSIDAHHLYSNATEIFLNIWCSSAPTVAVANVSKLLILFHIIFVVHHASIDPGVEECFFHNLKFGSSVDVEYQVIDGDFKKSENTLRHTVQEDGDYKFCWDNSFSSYNSKTVFFEILVDTDGESDDWNWDEDVGLTAEDVYEIKVQDIQEAINRVHSHLTKVRHTQDQIRAHEARDRNVAESIFSMVNNWSMIQIIVMLAVGAVQVIMVRSLFDDSSRVHKLWKKAEMQASSYMHFN